MKKTGNRKAANTTAKTQKIKSQAKGQSPQNKSDQMVHVFSDFGIGKSYAITSLNSLMRSSKKSDRTEPDNQNPEDADDIFARYSKLEEIQARIRAIEDAVSEAEKRANQRAPENQTTPAKRNPRKR